MEAKILINDFATRSFRDIADQDYIAARLSYRHGLYSQFHWQSLQALEKYLKAILLYNRIKATNINHDIECALEHTKKLPFEILRSNSTNDFIRHLSNFGRFRYLESSYFIRGPKLVELDRTVWEIRRYCKVIDYEIELPDGNMQNMLEPEIEMIKKSEKIPPQKFKITGGLLENIIEKTDNTARNALIWQNAFFGKVTRNRVRVPIPFHAVNSPLSLHPEILDEVIKYVFLPKEVINAYREIAKKKKK
ncbi:MAG: HEPN domain-containing protein [Nitrosomonas sp.]|nr:HEPN domain-containing protein [Nitrosomonas sp.]